MMFGFSSIKVYGIDVMKNLPSYLFVSSVDGSLSDTRKADWNKIPLRTNYKRAHSKINNVSDLKATLRNGPYTQVGSYPLYFITDDGAALCFETVRKEFGRIISSIREQAKDGWCVVACEGNYEETDLVCAHCGKPIESAYQK